MTRTFYVCSYGGSGSKMLWRWLGNFGKSLHIHSRNPSTKLQHVGGGNLYHEWFNGIPLENSENVTVLFIYRDPVDAILSRFNNPNHLLHIQVPNDYCSMNIVSHAESDEDLYGIGEFFDNYTDETKERNYDVVAVKYETFFENIDELKEVLGINSGGVPDPVKRETKKDPPLELMGRLRNKYTGLRRRMDEMPGIKVIRKSEVKEG